MNITNMLIAIIILSITVVLFSKGYADIIENYNPQYTISSEKFGTFNQSIERINTDMTDIQNRVASMQTRYGAAALVGGFIDAMSIAGNLVKVVATMPDIITDYINLMQCGVEEQPEECFFGFQIEPIVTQALFAIVFIIFFMKIAAVLLRRESI